MSGIFNQFRLFRLKLSYALDAVSMTVLKCTHKIINSNLLHSSLDANECNDNAYDAHSQHLLSGSTGCKTFLGLCNADCRVTYIISHKSHSLANSMELFFCNTYSSPNIGITSDCYALWSKVKCNFVVIIQSIIDWQTVR